MKYIWLVFLLLVIVFSWLVIKTTRENTIKDYQTIYGTFLRKGAKSEYIVIRKFIQKDNDYILCVDPNTLLTYQCPIDSGVFKVLDWKKITEVYNKTPYIKAIKASKLNSKKIQNAGITHVLSGYRGVYLTIDLCPSKLHLDRAVFRSIIREFSKVEKPVPIAIAITGLWIKKHHRDLSWIKELISNKEIKVDWINHSYHHKTNKKLPINENFLLSSGTDLNGEILLNEVAMLENKLLPSVMFRFPGLVSDEQLFMKVTEYGLIPVGSNAWLAKNELVQNGSIVLVHGNGNEQVGVEKFLELIQNERTNIKTQNWLLYDLRESLSKEDSCEYYD